jgi:ATP-binding cassette, subfamily B, bacterial HlyB/CyaB
MRARLIQFQDEDTLRDGRALEALRQTMNRIKVKAKMIFMAHQVPKGMRVEDMVGVGQRAMHMSLVKEGS